MIFMEYIKYHINKGWDSQWTEIEIPFNENESPPLLLKTGYISNKQNENKEIINLLMLKIDNPIKNIEFPKNGKEYIKLIKGKIDFNLYNNEQNKNKNIYLYVWNELPLEIKNFQSGITDSIFTNGKKYQTSPSFTSLGANTISISDQELPLKKSKYLYIAIYYEENPDIKIDIKSFKIETGIDSVLKENIKYKINYMYNDNIIFFKDYFYKNSDDKVLLKEIKDEIKIKKAINTDLYKITLDSEDYKDTKISNGEYQRIYFPKIIPIENAVSILFNDEKRIYTKIGERYIFYPSKGIEEFNYWEINDGVLNYNYILDLIVEEKYLETNSYEIKIKPYYRTDNIINLNIHPSAGDNSTIDLKIPITVNKENKFYFPANYKNKAIQYYHIGDSYYSPYIEYSKNDFENNGIYITKANIEFLEKDGDPWQWPYFQKLEENNLKPIDLQLKEEELDNGRRN